MADASDREWLEKFFDEFDRNASVDVLTSTGVVYSGTLYGYDLHERAVALKLANHTVHIFVDHIVAILEKADD